MNWLNQNAGAVQAACAVAGVVGLALYCWLTHCIRRSTVAQQKAAQAPMLMIEPPRDDESWKIQNYGAGPATKVWWKPGAKNEATMDWYEIGSLAPNDSSDFPHHSRPQECRLYEMYEDGVRLHYSDMAGNHYATSGKFAHDAFIQDWDEIGASRRLEPWKQRSGNKTTR